MTLTQKATFILCYHCGEPCNKQFIRYQEHAFCCEGCRAVYELLQEKQLCEYYELDAQPGATPKVYPKEKWAFLDNESIAASLLQFRSADLAIVNFHIPGLHCTSCIYLLENLHRLAEGVLSTEVNFLKKEALIKYDPRKTGLRAIAEKLAGIGYAPDISLAEAEKTVTKKQDRSLSYKVGIAAFCFTNIMFLSLPEYFDMNGLLDVEFIWLFRVLNGLLAVPALVYAASDIFRSAWAALRLRSINMDLPIAIGLSGLTIQSYYDVLTGNGSGYFDSMTGFIFFLLVGRFFQQRTQKALSFDRDFKAYFPLAVTRIKANHRESTKVTELKKNDIIEIHHEELIPADSILESAAAEIDYAFVTGESRPVSCHPGELLYAGGRNKGASLRLRVMQEVSQSYLTRLWNAKAFEKSNSGRQTRLASRIATWFTFAVIAIATGTAIYWLFTNPAMTMRAVTSVLIVACPCVLALTLPFTYGAIMRVMSRNGLYLKNGEGVEALGTIDTIVFDKTGTLTQPADTILEYEGELLSNEEKELIAAVASQSAHPVSRSFRHMSEGKENFPVSNWSETVGQGLSASVAGRELRIGSLRFVNEKSTNSTAKGTYVSIDGKLKGRFTPAYPLRKGVKEMAGSLSKSFRLFVLSGDDDRDSQRLSRYFSPGQLYFRQGPENKLDFITHQQESGHKVMMIGDGLNDAAALKKSDFGITITDDINVFTPAADAILDANNLDKLPRFAGLAKASRYVVYGSFLFSASYNIIGLSFAVRGELQPWVAAILMPLSSITVLLYTQFSTRFLAEKYKL